MLAVVCVGRELRRAKQEAILVWVLFSLAWID